MSRFNISNMKSVFEDVFGEISESMTRRRKTVTVNSYGEKTAATTSEATISIFIQELTDKMFFKGIPQSWGTTSSHVGWVKSGDIQLKDIVTDGNSVSYIVEELTRTPEIAGTEMFIVVGLKKRSYGI